MKETIKFGEYEVLITKSTLKDKQPKFEFYANRNGEYKWRDLSGDNLVMAMFYRIQELEEELNSRGTGGYTYII